jgi:hypothetical protein
MVTKTKNNKVTIPKEVATLPTINEIPIIKIDTPKTGSPTTGNSGLVSVTKTKVNTKVQRKPQIKTQIRSKINNNKNTELGISQKRRLAYTTARHVLKIEQPLNKVLKLLLDNNIISNDNKLKSFNVITKLTDPVTYNLDLLIEVKDPTKINIQTLTKQLNSLKLFSNIEVLPTDNPNTPLIIQLSKYTQIG